MSIFSRKTKEPEIPEWAQNEHTNQWVTVNNPAQGIQKDRRRVAWLYWTFIAAAACCTLFTLISMVTLISSAAREAELVLEIPYISSLRGKADQAAQTYVDEHPPFPDGQIVTWVRVEETDLITDGELHFFTVTPTQLADAQPPLVIPHPDGLENEEGEPLTLRRSYDSEDAASRPPAVAYEIQVLVSPQEGSVPHVNTPTPIAATEQIPTCPSGSVTYPDVADNRYGFTAQSNTDSVLVELGVFMSAWISNDQNALTTAAGRRYGGRGGEWVSALDYDWVAKKRVAGTEPFPAENVLCYGTETTGEWSGNTYLVVTDLMTDNPDALICNDIEQEPHPESCGQIHYAYQQEQPITVLLRISRDDVRTIFAGERYP